ncbi:MAG: hypothetical protein EAZ97_11105, partial [Bacteroidetes bacterium]
KAKRRNSLETLLSIFDQSNRADSRHILNVSEEDFPEEYREIIRRLQKANGEQEIRKQMDLEDDLVDQFGTIQEVLKEKDQLIVKTTEELDKKRLELSEKDEFIAKLQREIEEMKNKKK